MPASPSTPAADLWQGLKNGLLAGTALLALVLSPSPGDLGGVGDEDAHPAAAARPALERRLDFADEAASPDARHLAAWVVARADNGDRPFAIVDKVQARVHLFQPSGRLIASSPVLLGYAHGDDSVAGIGQRPIDQVKPGERTTPAGRHLAHPGRNAIDDDVLWVDYDAAVSMHRVRPTEPRERRLARLASPSPRDNRISYGCINLPHAFFDEHFWPHFGSGTSVVYVLPEIKPLEAVFPALAQTAAGA